MNIEHFTRTSIGQSIALSAIAMAVIQLSVPGLAEAKMAPISSNQNAKFEVTIDQQKFSALISNVIPERVEIAEVRESEVQPDPLEERKRLLREYLEKRAPRFVPHTDLLAELPYGERVIQLSGPESSFGKRCYRQNNCWGITYRSGLAQYATLEEGILDTHRVIAKRYSTMSYQQMCGIYVQPCNSMWLNLNLKTVNEMAHIPKLPN